TVHPTLIPGPGSAPRPRAYGAGVRRARGGRVGLRSWPLCQNPRPQTFLTGFSVMFRMLAVALLCATSLGACAQPAPPPSAGKAATPAKAAASPGAEQAVRA